MTDGVKFDSWALVELFGHTRMVGKVTEQTIGGIPFVRVDVPENGGNVAYTRFLGNGAIYAITPLAEEVALELAKSIRTAPVSEWDVRRLLPDGPAVAEQQDLRGPDYHESEDEGF